MPSSTVDDHDGRYYTQSQIHELIAGANFDFYLSEDADPSITDYYVLYDMDPAGSQTTDDETITDDGTLIRAFITQAAIPTFTTLSEGVYSLHIHLSTTTGAQVSTCRLYWELYKRTTGDDETLLITSEESDVLTDSVTSYEIHGSLAAETILGSTDRLVLKLYGNLETVRPDDPVITIYMEGSTATRISVRTTIAAFDERYLMLNGSNAMAAALDMGSNLINNVTDPSDPQDAATKKYVDDQLTAEDLDFAGDAGTGAVDLDSQTLTIAGTANEIETSASGQILTVGIVTNPTLGGANFTGIPSAAVTNNVSATAAITDHSIVRGHTGAKVVQGSSILLDDSDNMTGVGNISIAQYLYHTGDADTHIAFGANTITFTYGGTAVTAANITTNNAKVTESTSVSAPLVLSTYAISIPAATSGANGYLTSTDWTTFNGKSNLALGATETTAYRGDRGTTAYDHVSASGASHSYINQDVTTTGTPSFNSVAIDNITIDGSIIKNTAAADVQLFGQNQVVYGIEIGVNGTDPAITPTSGNITFLNSTHSKVRIVSTGADTDAALQFYTDSTIRYSIGCNEPTLEFTISEAEGLSSNQRFVIAAAGNMTLSPAGDVQIFGGGQTTYGLGISKRTGNYPVIFSIGANTTIFSRANNGTTYVGAQPYGTGTASYFRCFSADFTEGEDCGIMYMGHDSSNGILKTAASGGTAGDVHIFGQGQTDDGFSISKSAGANRPLLGVIGDTGMIIQTANASSETVLYLSTNGTNSSGTQLRLMDRDYAAQQTNGEFLLMGCDDTWSFLVAGKNGSGTIDDLKIEPGAGRCYIGADLSVANSLDLSCDDFYYDSLNEWQEPELDLELLDKIKTKKIKREGKKGGKDKPERSVWDLKDVVKKDKDGKVIQSIMVEDETDERVCLDEDKHIWKKTGRKVKSEWVSGSNLTGYLIGVAKALHKKNKELEYRIETIEALNQ